MVARVRRELNYLLSVGVVLAVAAGGAAATENLPEYGKCEAQAGGKYVNARCTKLAKTAEKQKYEWHPLAEVVPFKQAKERLTGEATLEQASGTVITCGGGPDGREEGNTGQIATGEYGPGNQVKHVVMFFNGCKSFGVECNSEGERAEHVTTHKLQGEPGVVHKEALEEKNIDGVDLKAEEGENVAEFVCGPAPIVVRGGVVVRAQADSTGGTTGEYTNKMAAKYEVEYVSGANGVQSPREWTPNGGGFSHAGHEPVVEHLETSFNAGSFEEAGLTLTTVQESSPNTAKVELRQCESNIVC